MDKHSLVISGHSTSISLEPEFWTELKAIANSRRMTVASLIEDIDNTAHTNLSAAIRVYILKTLKQKIINNK